MKIFFTKHSIFSFLTILALILNVAISGISNDSIFSNIIKIVSSALLLVIFFIHIRLSDIQLFSPITSKALRQMGLIIIIIIACLAITLIYSTNPGYGARKIINIIISDIPNIVVLFYLVAYQQKAPYQKHLIIIIAIGFILTLIALLVFQPFNHSTIYQFEPQRWSHVFIGRMISFLTLIVFMYLLNQKDSKKIFTYSFFFTIGLYITYLTGLRSALIGLALFTIVAFIWTLYKKDLGKYHIYSFIIILIVAAVLIYVTPQGFSTSQRISNLVKIEDLGFGDDAAILTRVESYKLSWQMFTERPLIGYGFGSFNGYNNIKWTTIQKYPHNIILEILSELGIVGLILFLLLCYLLIRRMLNAQLSVFNEQSKFKILPKGWQAKNSKVKNDYSPSLILSPHFLLFTFFFSFWLAMFSKDISTQGFLWLFLIVPGALSWAHSDE